LGRLGLSRAINTGYFALKALSKDKITRQNQQDHVIGEYKIMRLMNDVDHPCIMGLHCALQDSRYIYYVCDPGGSLADIWKRREFPEDVARFYAGSVVLVFEQLHCHNKQIAYR